MSNDEESAEGSDDNDNIAADSDESSLDDASSSANKGADLAMLGGRSQTPALCLLDGYIIDDDSKLTERITLPITGMPATLGRDHSCTDKSTYFFGMGRSAKAISRQHCRIEYWVDERGRSLRLDKATNKFVLQKSEFAPTSKLLNPQKIEIPKAGFYVITCNGKNRILVNGQLINQGQTCILPPNSALRISTFLLYFLLPSDHSSDLKTMNVPASRRRSLSTQSASGGGGGGAISNGPSLPFALDKPPPPKRIRNTTAETSSVVSGGGGGRSRTWTGLQAEVDTETTEVLLKDIDTAISTGVWDRRHQAVGATLSYRAILESIKDPAIYELGTTVGVSRGKIMDWIANSNKFKKWVRQMNSKLEPKSYQSSITKALLRAKFHRTNTTGRYIKWMIPESLHGDGPPPGSWKENKNIAEDNTSEGSDDDDGSGNDNSGGSVHEEESGDDDDNDNDNAGTNSGEEQSDQSNDSSVVD